MYSTSSRMIRQSFNSLNAQLNSICHLLVLLGAHHILHVGRIRVKIPCFMHLILLETKTCLYVRNLSFISISPYTSLFLVTFRFPVTSGTELWLNNSFSSWELDCMRQLTLVLFCSADMVRHSTCVKSVCQESKHGMWGDKITLLRKSGDLSAFPTYSQ